VQEEHRFQTLASVWISFAAVIANEEFGQSGHNPYQLEAAARTGRRRTRCALSVALCRVASSLDTQRKRFSN
jgi:hypothetical protein